MSPSLERTYSAEAISNAHLSGSGEFTPKKKVPCLWLESEIGCFEGIFNSFSCTGALEIAAIAQIFSQGMR